MISSQIIDVWLSMFGYRCLVIDVWLSMFGYQCLVNIQLKYACF